MYFEPSQHSHQLSEAAEQPSHLSAGPKTVAQEPFRPRYLAALTLLRDRAYGEARAALTALAKTYPRHRLQDRVLYWRGEAAYAQRDYQAALDDFSKLLERFPDSEKRPESMYKAGLCRGRLGQFQEAAALFAQVRQEFPDSAVAQLISKEGLPW